MSRRWFRVRRVAGSSLPTETSHSDWWNHARDRRRLTKGGWFLGYLALPRPRVLLALRHTTWAARAAVVFTIASTAEAPRRKQFTIKALGDFSELLRGLRPGRRVFLDGSENDIELRPEIEQLRSRLSPAVVYTLQRPHQRWRSQTDRIDAALLDRWLPRRASHRFDYFVCGPPSMVVETGRELRDRGAPCDGSTPSASK